MAGDPFMAIARYIRDLKDAVATYRHMADSSVAARELAWRRLEEIAALVAKPLGGGS